MTTREIVRLRRPLVIIMKTQPVAVVVPIQVYEAMQQMAMGIMGPILDKVSLMAEAEVVQTIPSNVGYGG